MAASAARRNTTEGGGAASLLRALPRTLLALLLLLPGACGGKGPGGEAPPAPAATPAAAPSPGGGEPFRAVPSPGVAVPADAPRVTSLRLVPDPSRPTGLGVEVQGTDPRGKGIDYEISWTLNGEEAGTGPFLGAVAKRGDRLRVTVRPFDLAGSGAAVSLDRDVANVPPAAGSPVEASFDGSAWSARVPASDGDGDSLSFRLKAGPPGMTVDGEGRVRWSVPAGYAGTASATVAVSDGAGGEADVAFRVTIRND